MTKHELLLMLDDVPDDAIIQAFDADSGSYEGITGCVTYAATPQVIVELYTDEP